MSVMNCNIFEILYISNICLNLTLSCQSTLIRFNYYHVSSRNGQQGIPQYGIRQNSGRISALLRVVLLTFYISRKYFSKHLLKFHETEEFPIVNDIFRIFYFYIGRRLVVKFSHA